MIKTLLLFLLSCINASLEVLRIAIIKALLPRMPLPNWRKEVIQVGPGQVENSHIRKLWKQASTSSPGRNYFECDKATRSQISTVPVKLTPSKPAVVEIEFSIYADPASQDTGYLLTPLRPPVKEVNFTLLKNASERVSEILRENRRRLDAGEDPNTVRKEARRKRAIELSAARRGRAKLFLV